MSEVNTAESIEFHDADTIQEPVAPVADTAPIPVVADPVPEAPVVVAPAAPAVSELINPAPAPVAVPAATPVVDALMDFNANMQDIIANGTTNGKALVQAFESYIQNMVPGKPVDPAMGANHQYSLYKAIKNVLDNSSYDEFKFLWNIILAYFSQYQNTVFHDRYVFRFSEHWSRSKQEIDLYHRLLNLIRLTHNRAERAIGLKQVDMQKTLSEGLTEEARQKVITFYN